MSIVPMSQLDIETGVNQKLPRGKGSNPISTSFFSFFVCVCRGQENDCTSYGESKLSYYHSCILLEFLYSLHFTE